MRHALCSRPAGLIDEQERLLVNPADLALPAGATLIVVAANKPALLKSLRQPYSSLRESERERLRWLAQPTPALQRAAAALECVPLLVGNPDSESLDADSVPCVPPELASRLTTPAAVKAFVAEFQQNAAAQEEQLTRGSLMPGTAEAMAADEHIDGTASLQASTSTALGRDDDGIDSSGPSAVVDLRKRRLRVSS